MSYFKEAINKQAKTLAEIEDAWSLSPKEVLKKKWINVDVVLAEFDKWQHTQEQIWNDRLEKVRQTYKTAYQGTVAANKQKLQQLLKNEIEWVISSGINPAQNVDYQNGWNKGYQRAMENIRKKFEQELQQK